MLIHKILPAKNVLDEVLFPATKNRIKQKPSENKHIALKAGVEISSAAEDCLLAAADVAVHSLPFLQTVDVI